MRTLHAPPSVLLNGAVSVRILDISPAGVLLSSSVPVVVGGRAVMHTTVGHRSLAVPIEIRHVAAVDVASGGTVYRAGAVFAPATAAARADLAALFAGTPRP